MHCAINSFKIFYFQLSYCLIIGEVPITGTTQKSFCEETRRMETGKFRAAINVRLRLSCQWPADPGAWQMPGQ
jgi:hypothetical protein